MREIIYMYIYIYIYIYIYNIYIYINNYYICIKNVINTNCLSIDNSFLLNKRVPRVLYQIYKAKLKS